MEKARRDATVFTQPTESWAPRSTTSYKGDAGVGVKLSASQLSGRSVCIENNQTAAQHAGVADLPAESLLLLLPGGRWRWLCRGRLTGGKKQKG